MESGPSLYWAFHGEAGAASAKEALSLAGMPVRSDFGTVGFSAERTGSATAILNIVVKQMTRREAITNARTVGLVLMCQQR
jgi:hypothetical protein